MQRSLAGFRYTFDGILVFLLAGKIRNAPDALAKKPSGPRTRKAEQRCRIGGEYPRRVRNPVEQEIEQHCIILGHAAAHDD